MVSSFPCEIQKPLLSRYIKPMMIRNTTPSHSLYPSSLPSSLSSSTGSTDKESQSPSSWSGSESSLSEEEDSGNAFENDVGVKQKDNDRKLQRHRGLFSEGELQFLYEELSSKHQKAFHSEDVPCSPCSCTALQAYSTVYEWNRDDSDDLLSQEPYICFSCWDAFRCGQRERMILEGIGGLQIKRTYFDFQNRPLLTVTIQA